MATSTPPFLYPPGSPLMHPPLALRHSRMYGFWVAGQVENLQAGMDATLNAAAGAAMRFVVVTGYVLLTFTAVEQAFSTDPDDRAKGWGRETDIVTWVLVARIDAGQSMPSGFYACPLYIWVDDCMALINGRELFGYPKYECRYTMPAAGAPATRFSLAAKGFEPFAPTTQLAVHPLLDVTAQGPAPVAATPFSEIDAWREAWWRGMTAGGDFWRADAAWRDAFQRDFQFPALQQVFLKQFPDARGERAVYQAVVAAPATIQAIHGIEMLGGDWQLNLLPFASFPLATSLGWALGPQPARLGFHIDMDFSVACGSVLVDATAGASP